MSAFFCAKSAVLSVTAAAQSITIPHGHETMVVSNPSLSNDVWINFVGNAAIPAVGTFADGLCIQRGTTQAFSISKNGGPMSYISDASITVVVSVGSGE